MHAYKQTKLNVLFKHNSYKSYNKIKQDEYECF
jgi:hypothetical protein